MSRQIIRSALALAVLTSPLAAQQAKLRNFTIDDALEIRATRIDDVSRDARWTAFTVRNNATHTGATPPMNLHPFLKSPSPSLRCRISIDVRRNPRACWA